MPYLKGTATSFDDLVAQLVSWATDSSIHGNDAWELVQNLPHPKGTILKAHGFQEGEHLYIGLMTKKFLVNKTYREWFLQPEVIKQNFIYCKDGLNIPRDVTAEFDNDSNVTLYSHRLIQQDVKDVNKKILYSYFVDQKEIYNTYRWNTASLEQFSDNSQALFLSCFKQYSAGMDMHEQPGSPQLNIRPRNIKYYPRGATQPSNWCPPVYPGVGLPAIGSNYEGFIDGYCDFWFVKDAHRVIIVVKDRDQWQTSTVGFMDTYDSPTIYPFPALVVGGTSGVTPILEPFYYGGTCPTVENGFRFNYNHKNWNLSRGNPSFAASWTVNSGRWDDRYNVSQVQLMMPDGTWISFANWGIWKESLTEGCGECPALSYANGEPVKQDGMCYNISPTNQPLGANLNVLQPDVDTYHYQLIPLELCVREDKYLSQNPRTGVMGNIWRTYYTSHKVSRVGEVTLKGKKHLIIPSGFEGRQFHYPHGFSRMVDTDKLLSEHERLKQLTDAMTCIVRLED